MEKIMETEVWIRTDGTEIAINTSEANREAAKKLGWVLKINASKAQTIKVKRSKKDIDE
jgi:hypothetical protein